MTNLEELLMLDGEGLGDIQKIETTGSRDCLVGQRRGQSWGLCCPGVRPRCVAQV